MAFSRSENNWVTRNRPHTHAHWFCLLLRTGTQIFPWFSGANWTDLSSAWIRQAQRTEVIFLPGSPRRAPSLLPKRETRELAGLLTARSCRQAWTGPCQRACPRQCAGESAGTSQCYKREPRDRAKLPRRSGSPVMRPKTLPNSKSHTGKTRRSLTTNHKPSRDTHRQGLR